MSRRPTAPRMSDSDDDGRGGRGGLGGPRGGSSSDDDDQDFESTMEQLTRRQVLEIEEVFERIASSSRGGGGHGDGADADADREGRESKRRRVDRNLKGKGRALVQDDADDEDDDDGQQAPGGFMVDEDDVVEAGGGGFMVDDDGDDTTPHTKTTDTPKYTFDDNTTDDDTVSRLRSTNDARRSTTTSRHRPAKSILLDRVPAALEALHLDGDDGGVLGIFENAAREDREEGLQVVSKKNFFKVVAILIVQRDQEREYGSGPDGGDGMGEGEGNSHSHRRRRTQEARGKKVHSGGGKRRAVRMDVDEQDHPEEHDDSDPLELSSSDDDDDDEDPEDAQDSDPWADEDDLDGAFTGRGRDTSPPSTRRTTRSQGSADKKLKALPSGSRSSTGKKGKTARGSSSPADTVAPKDKTYRLSKKQRDECERMFLQFFSAPATSNGAHRSISVDEIRYVATLLNEKISDADVSRTVGRRDDGVNGGDHASLPYELFWGDEWC